MLKFKRTNLEPTRHWGLLLALGVIFIVLGLMGLSMTIALTLMSMLMLGVLIVIGGVAQIIDAFRCRQWKAVFIHALIGVLYLVGGALIIYDPVLTSMVMTMLLSCIFIVIGISRLMLCMTLRHGPGWGWFLMSGIFSVVLGILILVQWPFSSLWLIGLLIAIELVVAGWTYVFMAFALRRH